MTVGELIQKLQNYHDKTIVVIPSQLAGFDNTHSVGEYRIVSTKDNPDGYGDYRSSWNDGVPCVVIW